MKLFSALNVGSLQRRHPPVSSGGLSEVTCSGTAIRGFWAAENLETGALLILGLLVSHRRVSLAQTMSMKAPSEIGVTGSIPKGSLQAGHRL